MESIESKQMLDLPAADSLCKKEIAYIRSHTVTWESPVNNQFYLEYSYNRIDWFALNGGNSIPLPQSMLPITPELLAHDPGGCELSLSAL